jgi:hypothetical protein
VGSDEPVVGNSEVRRLEERIRELERLLTTLAYIHCRILLRRSGRSPGGSTITTTATLTLGSE